MLLQKAKHTQAFLKCGMLGFQGSGKTYTAMEIAIGICKLTGIKQIAFFDTETGSDFFIEKCKENDIELLQAKTRAFKDAIDFLKECDENGYVSIIDSITHVWRELCDSYLKKKNRTRLEFQDWNVIKTEWQEYTDLFVNSKSHAIVCGRAGFEYDYQQNEDGTKDLVKTGTKMKAESEFGFEPSLVIEMERTTEAREALEKETDRKKKQGYKPKLGSKWLHRAYILKDRTDTMNGQVIKQPTFKDFLPHIEKLNLGGEHLGLDTTSTSEGRFDNNGDGQWHKTRQMIKIELEEIQNALVEYFPSSGAKDKQAKIKVLLRRR